jgi:alpha-L-fucosidase
MCFSRYVLFDWLPRRRLNYFSIDRIETHLHTSTMPVYVKEHLFGNYIEGRHNMKRHVSFTFIPLYLLAFGWAFANAELPTEDPPVGGLHPLLANVIEQGPYEPQWESLVTHPMPDWFSHDKIGISAHWGPYAVPGWTPRKDTPYGVAYAEWYWEWLKRNKAVQDYHRQHYGAATYDDFFNGTRNLVTGETDGFLTEKFDADAWMRLFKQAGARYFFITSKHHDGFCLWDSAYTNRNAKQMGPKRDLYGEMVTAARRHGLRIGLYYSFYEWNNPIYRGKTSFGDNDYRGIKTLQDQDGDGNANEYVDDFMVPQIKELIDNYHPDYLCFDGEWDHGYPYWRGRQIVAYYYNQASARDQEVIVNDRFGQKKEGVSDTRGVYGDFYHVEYFANIDRAKPWSMWRGFGNSYGYNRNEHPSNVLSIQQVIRMIVDVVADNGNVEFNLGPKADGTIAPFEQERLRAMGAWLKINGAAIYGTQRSPVGILPWGRVTHKPASKTLYYHVYDWPKEGVIKLPGITNDIVSASLLANGRRLKVVRSKVDTVLIHVPQAAPNAHVSVIELIYKGKLKAEKYVMPPYVHDVPIRSDDTPQEVVEKAANVVPSPAQMLYHKDEFTGFIHFGPNTFTRVEWGNGKENPTVFNPGDTLDTDQWCRVMKAAQMKKVIITVKHHDGFCTWQTRYNDTFSVRAIPWRNGKGDVLRELADSCKKYGLKLGVYLSPADLYQIENEQGLYGNLSKYQTTLIPTDPVAFKTDPTRVRSDKPNNAPTFTVQADDYNRYFMNQLYELLTEYGPIHEVWFDGAHPKRKGGQKYIKSEWFDMIRVLAPDATIFGGPDIRWCGNEGGYTRDSEWNVLPIQEYTSSGEDRPIPGPGTEDALTAGKYTVYGKPYTAEFLYYMIAEVDTSIRAGWFWRNEHEQSVRTPDDVFDIYERSVGGNTGFLLNIPPDNKGRLGPRDEACLIDVGKRISATYGTNLATGAKINVTGKEMVLSDNKLATYWQPATQQGSFVVTLPQTQTINRFVLQEAIATVGQRIKEHALDAWIDSQWQMVATATTVGYKRILRFPAVTTDRFRVRILDSRLQPTVADIAAHYYNQPPPQVSVGRDRNHHVVLEVAAPSNRFAWKHHSKRGAIPNEHAGANIHYTLDGQAPTVASSVYTTPLDLPNGGQIRACTIVNERKGPLTDLRIEISRKGLRIHHVSSQQDQHGAEKAIDGDAQTFWQTSRTPGHPHQVSIDLGRRIRIEGVTYLPRQDKRVPDGMIESGSVETSMDGRSWTSVGAFRFGNLLNDPTQRTFLFDKKINARYVRITSKEGVQGKPFAGAAEIGILAVTKK